MILGKFGILYLLNISFTKSITLYSIVLKLIQILLMCSTAFTSRPSSEITQSVWMKFRIILCCVKSSARPRVSESHGFKKNTGTSSRLINCLLRNFMSVLVAGLDMNISQFLKSLGLEHLRDIFETEQVSSLESF